ncbi:hypothetical protein ACIBF1_26940 [Spirillospora sp. NPDC050679]
MARTLIQGTDTAGTDTGLAALEELGAELARRGRRTMILTSGPRPRLEILEQPGAAPCAQAADSAACAVVCAPDAGGGAWFWWAWADRIAPADQAARAAELVDRALEARGAA